MNASPVPEAKRRRLDVNRADPASDSDSELQRALRESLEEAQARARAAPPVPAVAAAQAAAGAEQHVRDKRAAFLARFEKKPIIALSDSESDDGAPALGSRVLASAAPCGGGQLTLVIDERERGNDTVPRELRNRIKAHTS